MSETETYPVGDTEDRAVWKESFWSVVLLLAAGFGWGTVEGRVRLTIVAGGREFDFILVRTGGLGIAPELFLGFWVFGGYGVGGCGTTNTCWFFVWVVGGGFDDVITLGGLTVVFCGCWATGGLAGFCGCWAGWALPMRTSGRGLGCPGSIGGQ